MSIRYTATIKLDTPQLVRCAHCDAEYVYEMKVMGCGGAETGLFKTEEAAARAAEQDALDNLNFHLNNLDELFNAVPCPECFRYQPYMHKAVGRERYDPMGCVYYPLVVLGFLVAVGAAIAWFALPADRSVVKPIGVGGAVAWLIGYVMWWRYDRLIRVYDPNSHDLSGREKRAAERAMTFAAFDDLQAERLKAAYNEHGAGSGTAEPRQRPWRPDPSAPQARVFEWWVRQSDLTDGVTITVPLSATETATVAVPEGADTGTVFDLRLNGRPSAGLRVRVSAVYVHTGEMRLE